VLLIGSDSPTLPAAHMTQAFELLGEVPVVLAPARDGGYCLIGASGGVPPVFDGIDWSTDRVLAQTIERLQLAGLKHASLPAWYDVDTADDLERLRQDLQTTADEQLRRLQRTIQEIVADATDY
jgi:glycosyltransferase A (GT-A) superfamily protein (DUF2064 family)